MYRSSIRLTAAMLNLALMTQAGPTFAEPAKAGPADLVPALRATGWQVETLADGGLEVRLARTAPPEAPATRPPPGEAEAAAWDRLRARGWRVERAQDGALLLFAPPPETVPPASSIAPPAPATPRATERSEPSPGTRTGGLSGGVEGLLHKRGWQAERQGDGSLLVYPLGRR
jgi:hypothetical protein